MLYTILLLVLSNIFMTLAWYGHLKLQQTGVSSNWPLFGVIIFSWIIAFFEYCCQVPANRIGFVGNGAPSLWYNSKLSKSAFRSSYLQLLLICSSRGKACIGIISQPLHALLQQYISYL